MTAVPGVTFLDHTADVGIGVRADDLAGLLHRAALGMLALLRGHDDADELTGSDFAPREPGSREPERRAAADDLEAPGPGSDASDGAATELLALQTGGPVPLLAGWLRELLFLHETAGRDYVRADFDQLDERSLRARVALEPAAPAVREIKGVTYHELHVRRTAAGWEGQVIFDV